MDRSRRIIPISIKSKMINLYEKNVGIREISRQVGYSPATVCYFMKRYKETNSVERRPGGGRRRVTNVREDSRIISMMLKNPYITAKEIQTELKTFNRVTVSLKTIRRRLSEYIFYLHRPAHNLTSEMRKLRLNWAKDHQHWTVNDWKRVVFSNESKVNLLKRNGTGVLHQEDCKDLMVWGCITAFDSRSLTIIEETMDAKEYKNVLSNFVIPTIESTKEHTKNPIYQDNSAPCQAVNGI